MRKYRFNNKTYQVDEQNFLIDHEAWDENFAEGMAKELSISNGLSDKHWSIIYFVREELERTGICPLVFQTCRSNDLTLETLKNLFPTGYLRGACLLAGIVYRNLFPSGCLRGAALLPSIEYKDRSADYYAAPGPQFEKDREFKKSSKVYHVNVFGYLVDPDEWDKEFAINKASEMNIMLTDRHLQIIQYLRNIYVNHHNIPTVFECCKANDIRIDELEKLFPKGYHRCALKIAGVPSIF